MTEETEEIIIETKKEDTKIMETTEEMTEM